MKTAGLPDKCPMCGASRSTDPGLFGEGQTLCSQCGDELHDREETMAREQREASRYHAASRLFATDWDWGHSHSCPECGETWFCERSGCGAGPQECQNCADLLATESVAAPGGYQDRPPTRSDISHRDLAG